jgi:peptidoglycan/xylan/chitin deacetylase (PgdA/CDA1 family)
MARRTFIVLLLCKLIAIALAVAAVALRDPRFWPGATALFFGADLWILYNLIVPSAQGLCRNFTHFETTEPEVWLTIDDGPDVRDTPLLLDLLDRHQAKATFFVIGGRAAQHPELLAEIVVRGHQVGHHTQTHPVFTFWCAAKSRLHSELDDALGILRAANIRPRWFRAPVGIKNFLLPGALAERKLQCVGWSVRSGDCLGRQPEKVVNKVMRHVRPGAIILMHEGPSVPAAVRVKAIAGVLEGLTANNYRCVLPKPDQLR